MKNWKTTLIGFVGAALVAFGGTLTDGVFDMTEASTAVSIVLLGIFSKDYNKTGV
jgi:spore maturation protein SpmA